MKNKAKAGLALLGLASALTLTGPALAQDTGFYVGFHIGQTDAKDACDDIGGPGISCDKKDTAWKILGGYQFNRHLAVELGYSDLGEASASGGGLNASIEATAFEAVAVGILPLADKFSVYGKLGLYRGDTDLTSNFGASGSESNTDMTFAVGVRYDFTKNLGVRGEWQKYSDVKASDGAGGTGESDVDVLSIGVVWKF